MLRALIPTLRTALPRSMVATRTAAIAFPARPQAVRFYAASSGLNKDDITKRVMDVLKEFEKVDGVKLSPTSSFTTDLGLDSLDAVEVVMAIEEEFAIEIPDEEADAITSVGQAIEYIAKTPEAH